MKLTYLLVPFLLNSTLIAKNHTDAMKSTLEQIAHAFEVAYAPAAWKNEWGNWTLDWELRQAKEKVDNNPDMSLKEFHRLIRDFVGTTQDYHVGVRFFSTEKATLPINIKGANGRYYISSIDRRRLPVTEFPYKVGDEVITFNDIPVDAYVQKIQKEELAGISETDKAIAEILLTHRTGRLAHIVPSGEAWLQICRKGRDEVHTVSIPWKYEKECILPPAPFRSPVLVQKGKETAYDKSFFSPLAQNLFELGTVIGQKKSFVPDLGRKIWQTSAQSFFNAYIFLTEGGERIGYVRVPRYTCGEEEAKEFLNIIQVMNGTTAALVLDQVDNPGGSIFYLYSIASILANEPLYVPAHNTILTQQSIAFAYEQLQRLEEIETEEEAVEALGETIQGYPVSLELVESLIEYFHKEIHEWNEERYFTEPTYLYGIEKITPHPEGHYMGPILMLVNSLDFSAGDFLPAIMQDNKRATLLGSRTAGAGGYILKTSFYNRFGIEEIRLTGSIATRLNNQPIENLGVTPDIPCDLTNHDLQNDYTDYKKTVLNAVNDLIKR